MSYPHKFDHPDHIARDEWLGMGIGPVEIGATVDDTTVPDDALTRVEVCFWKDDEQVWFDSDDATLTITDATLWIVDVPKQAEFLSEGRWQWAARFTAGDWGPKTLFEGRITVDKLIPIRTP